MMWMVAGAICVLLWVVLTFVAPVGLGVIHVLLGAGVLAWIRGWVDRETVSGSQ